MIFGLGMLIACIVNPYRLVIASFMTTASGVAVYLFFKHLIPGNEVFPEYIIAIAIGLIGIALMACAVMLGRATFTPGIFVSGVGIIELGAINGYSIGSLTPERFITCMLSFGFPGLA